MLYVNKGLQSTVTWQRRNDMNEQFMLEHNSAAWQSREDNLWNTEGLHFRESMDVW